MSFDNSSYNYLKSSDHKTGDDLKYAHRYFYNKIFKHKLDIATGAGHFTKVFDSEKTTISDISFNMLLTAKQNFNPMHAVLCQSEYLPFKNETFDLICCRIAMHHFKNAQLFFNEVFRCIQKQGYFILIDSIVDIEDAMLNTIELLRDKTHIRSYTLNEIIDFSKNKFRLENYNIFYKKHNFYEWASRLNNSKQNISLVKQKFLNLPENIKQELRLEIKDNELISYTDKKAIFIFKRIW
jgi:ubiquinone/menaquinone biosynthesis C-methylase UbiE